MQTGTHIKVISLYHCYVFSRHRGRNFCNYESPCHMRVNPMLATSLWQHFASRGLELNSVLTS